MEKLFCKICEAEINPGPAQSPMAELGIVIASCPTGHYTIHLVTEPMTDVSGPMFTDYVFVNGFEISRSWQHSHKIQDRTHAWHGEHKKLWEVPYAISDDELRAHYKKFHRLGVMK